MRFVSDLVGNSEDRFSGVAAHLKSSIMSNILLCLMCHNDRHSVIFFPNFDFDMTNVPCEFSNIRHYSFLLDLPVASSYCKFLDCNFKYIVFWF